MGRSGRVLHTGEGEPKDEIIGIAHPVRSEQIPEGYTMFMRQVRLLSGASEPAYYSISDDRLPEPERQEKLRDALTAGFIWALQTPEFADHETEDDDRSQEIGNMMSFALSQGFSENEVVWCYKEAYRRARMI